MSGCSGVSKFSAHFASGVVLAQQVEQRGDADGIRRERFLSRHGFTFRSASAAFLRTAFFLGLRCAARERLSRARALQTRHSWLPLLAAGAWRGIGACTRGVALWRNHPKDSTRNASIPQPLATQPADRPEIICDLASSVAGVSSCLTSRTGPRWTWSSELVELDGFVAISLRDLSRWRSVRPSGCSNNSSMLGVPVGAEVGVASALALGIRTARSSDRLPSLAEPRATFSDSTCTSHEISAIGRLENRFWAQLPDDPPTVFSCPLRRGTVMWNSNACSEALVSAQLAGKHNPPV